MKTVRVPKSAIISKIMNNKHILTDLLATTAFQLFAIVFCVNEHNQLHKFEWNFLKESRVFYILLFLTLVNVGAFLKTKKGFFCSTYNVEDWKLSVFLIGSFFSIYLGILYKITPLEILNSI